MNFIILIIITFIGYADSIVYYTDTIDFNHKFIIINFKILFYNVLFLFKNIILFILLLIFFIGFPLLYLIQTKTVINISKNIPHYQIEFFCNYKLFKKEKFMI